MNNYRHLLKFSMLLFIIAFALCINVSAEYEIPQKEEGRYVYDVEGTIKSKTIQKLENWCKELDEKADIQIFIVTFRDIKGNTVEPYFKADQVLEAMKEEGKETITIFVSEKEEKIVVDSTDGVDVSNIGYINIFYTGFDENDYSSAITEVVDNFVKVLSKQNNVQIENVVEEQPDIKEQLVKNVFYAVGTTIIVIVFIIAIIVIFKEEMERARER